MSHSHLPVQHLLKQLETYQNTPREFVDIRPDWLVDLVENAAELFDPEDDVARVGFQCSLTETNWAVDVYLGLVEHVGGPVDGSRRPAAFRFDVQGVQELFSGVDSVAWKTFSAESSTEVSPMIENSVIEVQGWIGDESVRLTVHGLPIADAGPAMRCYPDGRLDVV